ncbi:MAG TPA: hypothetical protein VJM11_00690 [Nevskiaceae bacterium]|nr:hypothetical protein [Nevskiaceae bacterium]
MSTPSLTIRSGAIVALRLFDVAYSIDLAVAEAQWRSGPRAASVRSRLSATPTKAVAFGVPPVILTLESIMLPLESGPAQAAVTARLYDFGVVVLALRVGLQDVDFERLTQRVNEMDRCVGPEVADGVWRGLLDPLRELLRPALHNPSQNLLHEDYLLGIVHQWNEPITAVEVEKRFDLVPLLTGEKRPLSESSRHEVLRRRFSYYEDDLVVLTWDRAFIVEPRGDADVADVLEVANAQLLEMRYYSELLDDELPRMYDHVEEMRRGFAPRRYSKLARRLYGLVAEVTELTEKVDNALQVTEDVYLARIYASALELYRVPTVSDAVDRKLSIIRDTYAALYDEASASRGAFLEIVIVLLILFEILMALFGHA